MLMVNSWVTVSGVPASYMSEVEKTSRSGVSTRGSIRSRFNWHFARSLFFLLAFLILFSGFTLVQASASNDQVITASSSNELIVSIDSGDTLWEIAKSYKKDSMDTRDAVHFIRKANRLSSSELSVGQSLIIPSGIVH